MKNFSITYMNIISILLIKILISFNYLISTIQIMCIIIIVFKISSINYFMKYKYFYKMKMLSFYMMMISMLFSMLLFLSKNIFYFLITFEMSIIPIFFYMMIFGVTEKKIISCMYLLVYNSIFSLMLIFFLVAEMKISKTNNMIIHFIFFNSSMNIYKMMMMLVFLVKIPMFIFHIWLPKAHVESSSFGSMVLAGILLKIGGFGLMVFMNFNMINLFKYYSMIFMMISSLYILTMCFCLNDMKMIIAYFSVTHMMFFCFSMFTNNMMSMNLSMMMMVSHSLSSPMMFMFCMNMYENFSSRMITSVNSMFKISNFYPWMVYLFMMFNISLPPTLNFMSEMLIMCLLFKFSMKFFALMSLFIIISGMITIIMVCKMMMMKNILFMEYFKLMNMSNIMIMLNFLMVSIIILVKLELFSSII